MRLSRWTKGAGETQGESVKMEDKECVEKVVESWVATMDEEAREEAKGREEKREREGEGGGEISGWRTKNRKEGKEERRKRAKEKENERRLLREMEERRKRRKNVCLRGTAEKEKIGIKEVEEVVERGLRKRMAMVKIIKATQMGEELRIMVEMKEKDDKKELLERATEMEDIGILVSGDLTWEERRVRYLAKGRVLEEKRKGREAKICDGDVICEGERWRRSERREVWEKIREDAGMIAGEGDGQKSEERRQVDKRSAGKADGETARREKSAENNGGM